MSAVSTFFATCPKGLESLLLQELSSLGLSNTKETVAGVYFEGSLEAGYRACLWSRLANKVLLQLDNCPCRNVNELYEQVKQIDWQQHLDLDNTFAIDFSGSLTGVKHSHFGALKSKDAIADYFTQRLGRRPNIDPKRPDVRINIRVHKGRLIISLDLSGESLHKRGYRQSGGRAPLKENLAAAILLRADWSGVASRGGVLLDPMCGSGTLLIEGALMMGNIAPGYLRKHWGFSYWKGHQSALWQQLIDEAKTLRNQALNREWPEMRGYDADPRAIDAANQNIQAAGLEGKVRVLRKELANFVKPTHLPIDTGLVITNPPYGERLGEESSLVHLYRNLGQTLKREFSGWQATLFTGNPELGKQMGIRSCKQYQLFNGAISSKVLNFKVEPEYFVESPYKSKQRESSNVGEELSAGAQMFANRLRKNYKPLQKWAQKNEISCYRIYDADMPEYCVAVDIYHDWVHVSEYAPPAKVDPDAAEKRLKEVVSAIPAVLGVHAEYVVLKQRLRQRGSKQYQRQDQRNELIEVKEGQATLLINLHDYLDTGLFLDHRPVRMDIAKRARGNRFLNLFCYTATASVHAALGGATFTDSVDLSSTYLSWADKNLALNGLSDSKHRTIRADVMEWIKTCDQQYDLILLDPPTFSNSKKMEGVLDIQRDHPELIKNTMKCLSKDGLLIFSNNHKKFILDEDLANEFKVENKTNWSLDKDFQRSKSIHQCWFVTHKN